MTTKPRLTALAAAAALSVPALLAPVAQADHNPTHTVKGDCMFDIRWLDDWADCRLRDFIAPATIG
jgi:hypothetical protein